MRPFLALPVALSLALAACGGDIGYRPPAESASLPPDAVQGAGDPVNAALTRVSVAFSQPARLRGQPADAARAIANMEFLAADLPNDGRYTGFMPTLYPQLAAARTEWRAALGIAPQAPAQVVINGLFAAARAQESGLDPAAALAPAVFTRGGAATVQTLANLPPLPQTNVAAVNALELLRRNEGIGSNRR